MPYLKKLGSHFYTKHLAILLVGIGLLLRLKLYFENHSLGLDEAALALEIIRRSFSEIVYGLSYNPSSPTAPAGFLFLEKGAIQFLANNEYVLRLFPLLFSIASLGLFYVLLRDLKVKGALVALGFFAFAGPLIFYSAIVKAYSCDVFMAVLIFWLASRVRREGGNLFGITLFGVVGALALWLSYGALFVLPGVGATLVIFSALKGQKKKVVFLMLVAALWVASFGAVYFFHLKALLGNGEVTGMWESAFMPRPIGSLKSLIWLKESFFNIFYDTAGISLTYLAGGFFFLGGIRLFQRDRQTFFMLASPMVIVLGASILHKYPFYARFILFLVPSLVIFIGEGVAWMAGKAGRRSGVLIGAVVVALFLYPMMHAGKVSHVKGGMREGMKYFAARYQEGDPVYMSNSAQYAYGYYHGNLGFPNREEEIIKIIDRLNDGPAFSPKKETIRRIFVYDKDGYYMGRILRPFLQNSDKERENKKRGWLVLSHVRKSQEEQILLYFNNIWKMIGKFQNEDVSFYWYDIDEQKVPEIGF